MPHRPNLVLLTCTFAGVFSLSAGAPVHAQTRRAPAARACHSVVFASHLSAPVVFGGAAQCGRGVLTDDTLWVRSSSQWSALAVGGPSPREDALMVYDPDRQAILLYGGRNAGVVHTDTWEWVGARGWRRLAADSNPGALEHGSATYDAARRRVVVFGGAAGRSFQNQTWEWSGTNWERMRVADATVPDARVGLSLVWDAMSKSVLLYGGFSPAGQFRDLWSWNGSRWAAIDRNGPTTTEGQSIVATDDGVIVFGPGTGTETQLRGWRRTSTGWTALDAPPTPVRIGAAIVYDPQRRKVMLVGGARDGDQPGERMFFAELTGAEWVLPGR